MAKVRHSCNGCARQNANSEDVEKLIDDFVIFILANVVTLDAYDRAIIKSKAEAYKQRMREEKQNGKSSD